MKEVHLRGNDAPFMNQNLRKAIRNRSKLRNIFIKTKTKISKENFNKQRNYCVRLLKFSKRDYFENLKPESVPDSKRFWKTVKPLLSDKVTCFEKIIIEENETFIEKDSEIASIFNYFFQNIIPNLNLPLPPSDNCFIHTDPLNNNFNYSKL
jgi:hypothetical protein